MVFTPVETIALILIVVSAIKIFVLLVKPMAWMNFSKKIYSNKFMNYWAALVLAAVVLYYLLQEINIVQILATIAFMSLLLIVGLAPYMNDLMKKSERQIKSGKMWKENWFYTLIWIILLAWGVKELFF